MTSSYPAQSATMEDPDQGWKPNNRPQSTVARNFMSELDSLFNLDGGVENLDKTVLEKKEAVTTQTKELEALEARLRAAEERLNQAKSNSPPAKSDNQRRPDQDQARLQGAASPLAQKTANMPGALPQAGLVETFDKLVSEGVIVYGPHESVRLKDEGYPLEFRICPALATKPHTVGATNHAFNQSRKWGPGSDMFCPDERLIITQLNGTHDLALNLFCVDRPQLLMLTLDSYKRQHEALDEDDFTVMLEVLRRFPSMYVIFNCGEKGGCSRVHKHLQGLKGPPRAFDHLMSAIDEKDMVPFQYFVHHFSDGFKNTSAPAIRAVYTSLLMQCQPPTDADADAKNAPPHNVVMWADRLVIIPRRSGSTGGASANAGDPGFESGTHHTASHQLASHHHEIKYFGRPRPRFALSRSQGQPAESPSPTPA
ncbi:ap4a phosphorylase 2 [Stemphylium lycopersici]|nr:ap4a phosphorylase 2 [Stemphylium lycopersici]